MGNQFDGPETRIEQIYEGGRGITGAPGSGGNTFSPRAQNIGVPVGYLRRAINKAPIDDVNLPGQAFDRAYDVYWAGVQDDPSPGNEQDAQTLIAARVRIRVGYLFGPALVPTSGNGAFLVQGAETVGAIATSPSQRVLGDAEIFKRAFTFSELFSGNDIDPPIFLCNRIGESIAQELPIGGRMMSVTWFKLWMTRTNANTYRP